MTSLNIRKSTFKIITLLLLISGVFLTGCTSKPSEDNSIENESSIVEPGNEPDESVDEVPDKDESTSNVDKGDTPTTPNEEKPTKPKELSKPTDKVTYGSIEFIDTEIRFDRLEDKADPTKEQGTEGWISKGVKGISRKEVRKVYVNGKYSHTETVKDSYVFKKPVPEQAWFGTKAVSKHRPDYAKEVIRLVNIESKKEGLQELGTGAYDMLKYANIRSEEISIDFSHNSSNKHYAEAIGKGRGATPQSIVTGWLNSSGHYKILMSPTASFAEVGAFEKDGIIYCAFLMSA